MFEMIFTLLRRYCHTNIITIKTMRYSQYIRDQLVGSSKLKHTATGKKTNAILK